MSLSRGTIMERGQFPLQQQNRPETVMKLKGATLSKIPFCQFFFQKYVSPLCKWLLKKWAILILFYFCSWYKLLKNGFALTEQPLVILRFSFEEAVNPLDWAKLYFHVCQVPHHPIHIVGHLIHRDKQKRSRTDGGGGSGKVESCWVNVTSGTQGMRAVSPLINNWMSRCHWPGGIDLILPFTELQ